MATRSVVGRCSPRHSSPLKVCPQSEAKDGVFGDDFCNTKFSCSRLLLLAAQAVLRVLTCELLRVDGLHCGPPVAGLGTALDLDVGRLRVAGVTRLPEPAHVPVFGCRCHQDLHVRKAWRRFLEYWWSQKKRPDQKAIVRKLALGITLTFYGTLRDPFSSQNCHDPKVCLAWDNRTFTRHLTKQVTSE